MVGSLDHHSGCPLKKRRVARINVKSLNLSEDLVLSGHILKSKRGGLLDYH